MADVRGFSASAKFTAVFPDGPMPWLKHFSPKTFGRL